MDTNRTNDILEQASVFIGAARQFVDCGIMACDRVNNQPATSPSVGAFLDGVWTLRKWLVFAQAGLALLQTVERDDIPF